jgi:hypothetical protein
MTSEPEQLLAEARAVNAADPDRAIALLRRVADSGAGKAWSEAHVDLAAHDYGQANLASAADHASAVLGTSVERVHPAARAAAGVLLSVIREDLDQDVDESLLLASIAASEASGQFYYAGVGLGQLSRLRLRANDRASAKDALERSVPLYEKAGSMTGGPGAVLQLAKLELEDGRRQVARQLLDRGIAHLQRFPYGGTSVRRLEDKLVALRASLLREE